MSNTSKVVLVTGCSSGFGYLTALTYARSGWVVFAGVKEIDEGANSLIDITKKEGICLVVIKMDVTSNREIVSVVKKILRDYGHIDVLINNAGYGILGPIEDFEIEEIKDLYDVNIFGTLRVIKAALPSMRQHRSGRIINISSINGILSFGLYGIYSSSKFALETISEVLRFEVKPFGIDVVIVEPGSFLTKFSENRKRAKRYTSKDTAYAGLKDPLDRDSVTSGLRQNKRIQRIIDPQRVADKLFEIGNADVTRMRYQIGVDAKLYMFIRKIVPDSVWESILRMAYKWK